MTPRKTRHKKVQQVKDQDGWTHVIRGPRLASSELNRPGKHDDRRKLLQEQASSVLSLDEMHTKYCRTQKLWAQEPLRTRFEQLFFAHIASTTDFEIDAAMILGLGSIAADNLDSSSMHQLVLFEHWLSFLRTHFTIPTIYVQDPRFHTNDEAFLTGLGYTIIADPEAYLVLTPKTFLFAPYLPWEVMYTFCYAAQPILLIGNGVHNKEDIFQAERLEILDHRVVKEFYASRKTLSLYANQVKGTEKHLLWLRDMFLYWPTSSVDKAGRAEDVLKMPSDISLKLPTGNAQIPETCHDNDKNHTGRVGPGKWQRGEGFVFDADFKVRLEQAMLQAKSTSSP